MTLHELRENKNWTKAVIVFTEDSFPRKYTELERSYEVVSTNNYFIGGKISNSIYGNCLDGTEKGVRLDYYIGDWKIERVYITE